jgi:hypothetical protein
MIPLFRFIDVKDDHARTALEGKVRELDPEL